MLNMATNVIFRNIANITPWRNRYMRGRGIFSIQDANLHHGDIRPFACPESICEGVPAYRSLFPLSNCPCLGFTSHTTVVKGFCSDQYFLLFGGRLHQATSSELCRGESWFAGAPFCPEAPKAKAGCSGCDAQAVSYVITYVTRHAGIEVESAPSPPSSPVAATGAIPNATVSWAAAPPGYAIATTRLYRTETNYAEPEAASANDTEFVFVAEFSGGKARTYRDNAPSSGTGGPLLTYSPMAFPAPWGLVDVARTEHGLAVATSHEVYISENGKPQFTWENVISIDDNILAIVAVHDQIFVFTDNRPVVISYTIRENELIAERIVVERRLPLASRASLSVWGDTIVFASTYGLYTWRVTRTSAGVSRSIDFALKPLLSLEQWLNINPRTVRGTCYEFGYIFTSDELACSLMLEFGEDGTDTIQETHIMPITYIRPTAFALDQDGHIVYAQDNRVYRWDYRRLVCSSFDPFDHVRSVVCEQCRICPWSVKFYLDSEGKNHFTHMRIEWDERSAPPLTLSFHIHEFGREIEHSDNMEVVSSRGFGLPFTNVSYQSCYAHLRGSGIVHEIKVATSAQELSYSSSSAVRGEGEEVE